MVIHRPYFNFMFKYLLLFVCLSAHAAGTYIPVQSGYDVHAGTASDSDGVLTNMFGLRGYHYVSNVTGTTTWMIPEQVFLSGKTNYVISINVLTTNGVSWQHGYGYGFQLLLYTNRIATNSLSITDPTNVPSAFYDSGSITVAGVFNNGTNITYIQSSNTVNSSIFSQTNLAFGLIKIIHNPVAGSWGSDWLLGGRIITR